MWQERTSDLENRETAERFGISVGAVADARRAFFGCRIRPPGWWRQKDVAALLLSDTPHTEIADALEISVGSVGRLRRLLRRKTPKRRWRSDGRPYGWTKEVMASLEGLINDGLTAFEIANRTACLQNRYFPLLSEDTCLNRPGRACRTLPK